MYSSGQERALEGVDHNEGRDLPFEEQGNVQVGLDAHDSAILSVLCGPLRQFFDPLNTDWLSCTQLS